MKRVLVMCGVILGSVLLTACAGNTNTANPGGANSNYAGMTQDQINNQVQASLTQAANQTQGSLAELSSIEKMRFQKNNAMPLADVDDPALNALITIKWYGPIEPLLQQVASLTGYQFQAFGKPPFSPILVNVDDSDNPVSALAIIRNVDVQAGLNAQILIFPKQKIISLRYAAS